MSNTATPFLFRATGWPMLIAGLSLLALYPIANYWLPDGTVPGGEVSLYLAASLGAAACAWAVSLLATDKVEAMALASSAGFALLSAMRLFAYGNNGEMGQLVGATTLVEAIFFAWLSVLFLNLVTLQELAEVGPRPQTIGQRFQHQWISFRHLPTWVQAWIMVLLMPVNLAALFFPLSGVALWVTLSFVFILVTNCSLLWMQSRLSRVMGLPHLVVWIPLEVYLLVQLTSNPNLSAAEFTLAAVVAIVNAISIAFDLWDAYRWLKGDRGFEWPGELATI